MLSRYFSLARFKLVPRFYCKIHKYSKGLIGICWHNAVVTFVELATAHSLWAPAGMPAILVTAGIFVRGYLAAAVNHKGWAVEGLATWLRTEAVLLASICKLYFITVFFMGAVVALGDKTYSIFVSEWETRVYCFKTCFKKRHASPCPQKIQI